MITEAPRCLVTMCWQESLSFAHIAINWSSPFEQTPTLILVPSNSQNVEIPHF